MCTFCSKKKLQPVSILKPLLRLGRKPMRRILPDKAERAHDVIPCEQKSVCLFFPLMLMQVFVVVEGSRGQPPEDEESGTAASNHG